FRDEVGAAPADPIVALLPGSRGHEVAENLRPMLEAAAAIRAREPQARFIVPSANAGLRPIIEGCVAASGVDALVLDGQAREVARRARVALVTSGTATLELLFHEVPMVVLYRASELKWSLARRFLLHVKWISLVNILADRDVVRELVGGTWTAGEVAEHALELLRDGRARKKMLARLHDLKKEVALQGASKRAAEVVLSVAKTPGTAGRSPANPRGKALRC